MALFATEEDTFALLRILENDQGIVLQTTSHFSGWTAANIV